MSFLLKSFTQLFQSLRQVLMLAAVVILCSGCSQLYLGSLPDNPWQMMTLPTDTTVLDIDFTGDRQHGWMVGKNSTLLETKDGGNTWEVRRVDLGDDRIHNFTSVSFAGDEGWVVGEPSVMLHTEDGGQSWAQISLSEKLPGTTRTITALGPQSAEMTTDVGAIYQTQNGGKSWQAMVEEAVGIYRNISRSPDGQYVTVSARGNFYSTWKPGQSSWEQHNRNSSRRLQNMGFGTDGQLWLLARGGVVQFSDPQDFDAWNEEVAPEFATSWGLLDLAYRTPEEIWVAGGSGNLLCSTDGGKTWLKDREVENVPSNLYKIVFFSPEQGFILGQGNTFLKYAGGTEAA
ncbi:MAG: photosynthesis system II assembly factor Ycf48 [Synechococcales bacterium]|nr:photosynthesis system II assembly factor Ycf48 [Synechococcales bacterium]